MFKQENNGYSKIDVDNYLRVTLEKLDNFQMIIESQRKEIEALEKRLDEINVSDNSDEIVEKAKQNADIIIFDALKDIKRLKERVDRAVQEEFLK